MPTADPQIAELQHAYRFLNVPFTASTRSIKKAHHRLVKRWHPDLYPAGSAAQAEATQMMKLVNEAHSLIAAAPLSQIEKPPPRWWNPRNENHRADSNGASTYVPLNTKRIEYWVRFTYGIFCGIAASAFVLRVAGDLNLSDFAIFTFLIAATVFTLLCGFVVSTFGEKWWR